MPTNVIMTGTGIVIPASFGLSVVTDPEGKIFTKGHFIDDSNEYKLIYAPTTISGVCTAKTAYRDELNFQ